MNMKSKLVLLILLFTAWGCQGVTTIELSAGHEFEGPWVQDGVDAWVGSGPILEGAIRHTYDSGLFIEYSHTSNLKSGPPFNDDVENSIDRVSFGKKFIIRDI